MKIPDSYFFLYLELMPFKLEKILSPFYEKNFSPRFFLSKNILDYLNVYGVETSLNPYTNTDGGGKL